MNIRNNSMMDGDGLETGLPLLYNEYVMVCSKVEQFLHAI